MRKATLDDMPRLMEMGRAFHAAVRPEWPWSDDGFADLMRRLMKSGHVTITDGGFMAGVKMAHPVNPHWWVAHELLWWAEDGSGPQHFKAFRKWASDADEIRWSCRADNDRVKRFYGKFSRHVEAVYSEVL